MEAKSAHFSALSSPAGIIYLFSATLCPLSSFHCTPVEEDLTAAVYTSQDSPATVVPYKSKDN